MCWYFRPFGVPVFLSPLINTYININLMDKTMNSANILCIILSGLCMSIFGIFLFFSHGRILMVPLRYFLPIPPIAVASYVFAYNLIKDFDGVPQGNPFLMLELVKSTVAAGMIFGLITAVIIFAIKLLGN
ncbi:hypothetical protein HRM2_34660 [Desulforapulum autotrophicum HRM2]|uniref:Uncharacterized protein n=2 Tax=Desulforapulum autotrophicum TaxID=2296 RepID=C0Q936_DESAH|nr:hypothetical protein HRM2_34660 [Desulforapulum autotrophicum HRM2]